MEIQQILKDTLKEGTVALLSFEGGMCPVRVLSVTEMHIRTTKPTGFKNEIFAGLPVQLELCSNRGCLVLQTEILSVPEHAEEGIILSLPEFPTNIFLRQFWRVSVNMQADLRPQAHPRKIKVIIRNISAGGMLLKMEEPLGIGETVDVFFSLRDTHFEEGKQFHFVGYVTHISMLEKEYLVSLKFVGVDPNDVEEINNFVIKTLRTTCPTLNLLES